MLHLIHLLERRFGASAKDHAGKMYLFGRIFASGARLYMAAIAVAMLLFNNIQASSVLAAIALLAVIGLACTVAGGIRSVIYTDALQCAVYVLAALLVPSLLLWARNLLDTPFVGAYLLIATLALLALILLAMSVASWVVIVWKLRLMRQATADVARCTAAFWQAPSMDVAAQRLQSFDRSALVLPLVIAANSIAIQPMPDAPASLASAGSLSQRLTRVLRDALHEVLGRLQFGQVLLATVGSTAPFVGLLGTVWGIYHALTAMAGAGQITIDRVSGPVGEALVMTAAGLAVAIPAVLAYNVFGRLIGRIEADLEGFARDLRELLIDTAQPADAKT